MSCSSSSFLPKSTKRTQLLKLIQLLGYEGPFRERGFEHDFFMWYGDGKNEISFVGVELYLYRDDEGSFRIDTRTRAGRSYWDLRKQNETIKAIHDYLGGRFETDEGRNRPLKEQGESANKLQSALFVPRWVFHNAMARYRLLRMDGGGSSYSATFAGDKVSDIAFMNDINPRFLVNSLLVTYYVSIWEGYLADSYIAIVRHAGLEKAEGIKLQLGCDDLADLTAAGIAVEEVLARRLSFQRPSVAARNFHSIDRSLDIAGALKRPYRRRKEALFDTIDGYVDLRNEIAHTGRCGIYLTDARTDAIADDFIAAVDCVYGEFASHYGFEALRDF